MRKVPTDPPYPANPAITAGVAALRCFSADITRDVASQLLPMWRRYAWLTDEERAEILSNFPPATAIPIPTHVEGYPLGGRR
jgi:hypothetical protein